jgi:CheY-like chemotaxis protein
MSGRAEGGLPSSSKQRQHDAVEQWKRNTELVLQLSERMSGSREARMDAHRRAQALRRTQEALVARTRLRIADGRALLEDGHLRAVLVHRNEWLRQKLALRLTELGVEVLAEADDGADGLGIAIAEQPDLVLVEDRLPSLPALELVAAVREYAGHALVGAQVEYEADIAPLVEAGANAVFSRRIPPAVMAEELHALLLERPNQPLLVS